MNCFLKKKGAILIALFFCVAILTTLSGAQSARTIDVKIEHEGQIILNKEYRVSGIAYLPFDYVFHNNSRALSKYFGSEEKAAYYLSEEFYHDAELLKARFDKERKDASLSFSNGEFLYVPETIGVRVDVKDICSEFISRYGEKISFELPVELLYPDVTVQKLKARTELIGAKKTSYATSSDARKQNIRRAVELIDGTVVRQGEEFSFNVVVGPRTIENGFRTASIIEYGRFVDGVGGGVCQAATTLYNAVLFSGLKVTNVAHHSIPASYVPLSLDAMVSSSTDFKFINDSPYDVYIHGRCDEETVEFLIFGFPRFKGLNVKLRSETVKEIPFTSYDVELSKEIPSDGISEKILTRPRSGFISESFVEIFEGETLISSTKIRHDYYAPQKGKKIIYENAPLH